MSSGRLNTCSVVGLVLDELHQLVLEDHGTGGGGEVLAHLEQLVPARADPEIAPLQIGHEILEPAHQALAVRLVGLAQDHGIGVGEVRGRQRVGDLPDVELGLGARMRVEPLRGPDDLLHPSRGGEVGLLEEVEDDVVAPGLVLEAAIRAVGQDEGLDRLAGQTLQLPPADLGHLLEVVKVGLDEPAGVGEERLAHAAHRGRDHAGIGNLKIATLGLALEQELERPPVAPAQGLEPAQDLGRIRPRIARQIAGSSLAHRQRRPIAVAQPGHSREVLWPRARRMITASRHRAVAPRSGGVGSRSALPFRIPRAAVSRTTGRSPLSAGRIDDAGIVFHPRGIALLGALRLPVERLSARVRGVRTPGIGREG